MAAEPGPMLPLLGAGLCAPPGADMMGDTGRAETIGRAYLIT